MICVWEIVALVNAVSEQFQSKIVSELNYKKLNIKTKKN